MNLLAMAFISIGYAVFYWGANQIRHWNKTVQDTEAATFKLLVGFPMDHSYETIHKIPFPYDAGSSGGTLPSSNGTGSSGGTDNGGGANLSPNYPGGSGTIPNPGIPGTPPTSTTKPGGGYQSV